MPLIIHTEIAETTSLGAWEITESEEQLLTLLAQAGLATGELKDKSHPVLRKQWLATRLILGQLLGQRPFTLLYGKNGQPQLADRSHQISITHSGKYAACLISRKYSVGIDIEQVRPRIARLGPVFLHPDEMESFGHEEILKKFTLAWCAKESIFKLIGIPDLNFREEVRVLPFAAATAGTLTARVLREGHSGLLTLHYREVADYMLVYIYDK